MASGRGTDRTAGRVLAPGMTSCGLAAGCGAGAGDFFSGDGGNGLVSLWFGGVGALLPGSDGGGLRSGARSRYRASRACASVSFISAVSSRDW
uniref:Uncharacterized protein n=1 Tax=Arundo donax TaxID=35708 RepID=A0A0A9D2I1_ARUDO